MNRTQLMLERLASTGLYNTDSSTQLYAEAAAWAEGISMIEDELDDIMREMFVSTAQGRGLELYENSMMLPLDSAHLNDRRAAVLAALSMSDTEYPPHCADKLSVMTGTDIEIDEENGDVIFRLENGLSTQRRSELSSFLSSFVPMCAGYQVV